MPEKTYNISAVWRMGPQRKQFTGFQRETKNGSEVSFTGREWYPLNGHNSSENPMERPLIPQTETLISDNGGGDVQKESHQVVVYQAEASTSS